MISFFIGGGGSGIIRGEQVAHKLGAKLNPTSGYEDDVCIYVKGIPPIPFPKKTYIDVVEHSKGLWWGKRHKQVGLIASSKSIYDYLISKSLKLNNKIVLIPQHHCNFERQVRTRKEVKVVGIIGNKAAFQYNLDDLADRLSAIGMELKTLIKPVFKSREEVCDFYKQIDIQVIWRPGSDHILRNPLKLINAMSFGIPTVAYPEVDFDAELGGHYISAYSMGGLVLGVENLRDTKFLYDSFVEQGLKKAEKYHIDHISKLYLKL